MINKGRNERIAQTITTPTTNRITMTMRFVSRSQADGASASGLVLCPVTIVGSFTSTSVERSGNAVIGSEKFAIENLLALNKTQPNAESILHLSPILPVHLRRIAGAHRVYSGSATHTEII
jgi:hypothetical protein